MTGATDFLTAERVCNILSEGSNKRDSFNSYWIYFRKSAASAVLTF